METAEYVDGDDRTMTFIKAGEQVAGMQLTRSDEYSFNI